LRDASLAVVQRLREDDISTEYSLTPAKGDKQFKRAMELNSHVALRCLQKDGATVCLIKDLASRMESEAALENVVEKVRGTLSRIT
jgi:histidyl-tRNA synthetase